MATQDTAGGVFGWLDTLTNQAGSVLGHAVDVVGTVAQTNAATQAAQAQRDQAAATQIALAQGAPASSSVLLWVVIIAVVGVGAAVLLRR